MKKIVFVIITFLTAAIFITMLITKSYHEYAPAVMALLCFEIGLGILAKKEKKLNRSLLILIGFNFWLLGLVKVFRQLALLGMIRYPSSAGQESFFRVDYIELIPVILTCLPIVIYFFGRYKTWDRSQLLVDVYKISTLFMGIYFLVAWDNGIDWYLEGKTVSEIVIFSGLFGVLMFSSIILFIIVASKRRVKEKAIHLVFLQYYVVFIFRHIILMSYQIENMSALKLFLNLATVVSMLILFYGILFYEPKRERGSEADDIPENVGKTYVLYIILAYVLVLRYTNTIGSRSLLELIIVIMLFQGLDYFSQKYYEDNALLNRELVRDALTGLYNRDYFLKEINKLIHSNTKEFAVFYIDLNRFKTINDIHGHDIGDRVLDIIGKRLSNIKDNIRFIARLGGDEFGAVTYSASTTSINLVGNKIIEVISNKITLGNLEFTIDASIGIVRYPEDAKDVYSLYKYADVAMYNAKKEDTRKFIIHSNYLTRTIERKNQIEQLLCQVDYNKDFEIWYQPQFNIRKNELIGIEGMIRLKDQAGNYLLPKEFVPIAEDIGKMLYITRFFFEVGMQTISDWNQRYKTDIRMKLNVSHMCIYSKKFYNFLVERVYDFNCDWLGLELAEHASMTSPEELKIILNDFKKLGLKVIIDDFGTGYSSLSYIKKFNIDEIKISAELVENLQLQNDDYYIINSIIRMARGLGLTTVAEGVDTKQQLDIISALGCEKIQGAYTGSAVPAKEFERLYLQTNQYRKKKITPLPK